MSFHYLCEPTGLLRWSEAIECIPLRHLFLTRLSQDYLIPKQEFYGRHSHRFGPLLEASPRSAPHNKPCVRMVFLSSKFTCDPPQLLYWPSTWGFFPSLLVYSLATKAHIISCPFFRCSRNHSCISTATAGYSSFLMHRFHNSTSKLLHPCSCRRSLCISDVGLIWIWTRPRSNPWHSGTCADKNTCSCVSTERVRPRADQSQELSPIVSR